MSEQTGTEIIVVSAEDEHDLVVRVLRAYGVTAEDASRQADMLVEGDLRGQHSHGLRRLPVLAARLSKQVASSGIPPVPTWRGPARLHLDGCRGLGPAVAHHALDLAIPSGFENGAVVVTIENSGHVGMLGPYVERIAEAGCVGIALTISEALVAPWGGSRAMVGTNPIGIGVPTDDAPLILDMSTAAVSAGKVLDYAARGENIPLGWAVDEHGDPTTDAHAALRGAIAPFGGAKGFALGVAFEALVGVLAGTAFGRDIHGTLDVDLAPSKGELFLILPVDNSGGAALRGVTEYCRQLRAEGSDGKRVLIPGDRARALRSQRLRDGIPLDRQLWDRVKTLLSTTV